MSRKATIGTSMLVLLASLVIGPIAGAPAHATVVDRGTFAGSETGVADELCGIAVVRDSTFSGSFASERTRHRTGKRSFSA